MKAKIQVLKNLYIFGSGGQAKVITDAALASKKFILKGIVTKASISNRQKFQFKQKINYILENKLAKSTKGVFIVAIGDNWKRNQVVQTILKNFPLLKPVSVIHPNAAISSESTIGVGTYIAPGVTIQAGTNIGNYCIINTNSSLDHDCNLDDNSSVGPGVVLGGNVTIGKYSAICLGAKIIHNIVIGENCVIGAAAIVLTNFADGCLAFGMPCKFISKRNMGDSYL